MYANGGARVDRNFPNSVISAVRQRASATRIRSHERSREAQLGAGAAQFRCGSHRVLERQHGRPEQPRRAGGAVGRQPVVIRPGDGRRRFGIRKGPEVKPYGRVEHRLIDALRVHVDESQHRVGATRLRLVEATEIV